MRGNRSVFRSKLPHLEDISKSSAPVSIPIRKPISLQIGIFFYSFSISSFGKSVIFMMVSISIPAASIFLAI